jgi:hypothetical protein
MSDTEFDFWALPKPDRARALIALVLVIDMVLTLVLLKDARNGGRGPGETALLWTAPSVAALIALVRRQGLEGVKIAQVVAWGFVAAGSLLGTFAMVFSFGATKSDRIAGSALIVALLALQMTIPAAIRWARTDLTLFEAFMRYMGIFVILVPMLVLGMLFS